MTDPADEIREDRDLQRWSMSFMKMRTLGRTGLQVSMLGFGCGGSAALIWVAHGNSAHSSRRALRVTFRKRRSAFRHA